MRIVIDFKNKKQGKVFLDWFKESGFDNLCENDHVHDDLPSELFYQKLEKCKLEREHIHYDGIIQIS